MRILFVDDNAMNRLVVRHMLGVAEVEMDEAEDAESGLCLIEQRNYDLILMDLRMPGMDGLAATRAIRQRSDAKAALPVIVLTADATSHIEATCLAAGANAHLQKPVEMDLLFNTIVEVTNASAFPLALA